MVWFSRTPTEVSVAGTPFVLAEEALRAAERRLERRVDGWEESEYEDPWRERPNPDWGATAVLLMARVQLDEMSSLLGQAVGDDIDEWESGMVRRALIARVAQHAPSMMDDLAFEIDALAEGMELRRGLQSRCHVGHGYAPDGTLTITVGPEYPPLPTIGLGGSPQGEMSDEPERVFAVAARLTRDAADLCATLGMEPEQLAPTDKASTDDPPSALTPDRGPERDDGARPGPAEGRQPRTTFPYTCVFCGKHKSLELPEDGLRLWRSGSSVSNALPAEPASVREALVSCICPACQDDVFSGE